MNTARQYDDPDFFYLDYWHGRDYEHQAEVIALNKLLDKRHFKQGVDIGGGYGRLTKELARFCDKVTLLEPSKKQREVGEKFLAETKGSKILDGTADGTGLPDQSTDVVIMVRVMHHLPNPVPAFAEINRILEPGGYLFLEVANALHFKSRLKHLLRGRSVSHQPVEVGFQTEGERNRIAFVNHHPQTVLKQLEQNGFSIEKTLSVSNLRLPGLKKLLSPHLMAKLEKGMQEPLRKLFFGPSFVVLAIKK